MKHIKNFKLFEMIRSNDYQDEMWVDSEIKQIKDSKTKHPSTYWVAYLVDGAFSIGQPINYSLAHCGQFKQFESEQEVKNYVKKLRKADIKDIFILSQEDYDRVMDEREHQSFF